MTLQWLCWMFVVIELVEGVCCCTRMGFRMKIRIRSDLH